MREIDEKVALQVVEDQMIAYFNVAIRRNENLWSVKREIIDKLMLLNLIGVITKEELEEEKEKVEKYYRKKNKKWVDLDVGFQYDEQKRQYYGLLGN